MINPEQLFQFLANKDWASISAFIYQNSKQIGKNPLISRAIEVFEQEFFKETDTLALSARKEAYSYPSVVIELGKHTFSEDFINKFIDKKIELLKALKSDDLIGFASANQHRESARVVIQELREIKPEIIANARREKVSIKSNEVNSSKPKTINLFKSLQEQYFFEAVREAFPTYHPYPNVALSSVIDFDVIQTQLSADEKSYFFRALIDVVVFDTRHAYEPKFFIELDSVYHDNERSQKNDDLKNNIFSAANIKLIRIRAHDQSEVSVAKFKDLVMEVMRGL